MRVREEDRNMVLLAAVTLFSLVVAGGLNVMEAPPPPAEASKPLYVADEAPVRVIGSPFVPNTNPRER